MNNMENPAIYFNGRVVNFEYAQSSEDNFFGGPFEIEIISGAEGLSLHRVFTLRANLFEEDKSMTLKGSIPFVYAFNYAQNEIEYELSGHKVSGQGFFVDDDEIKRINIEPSDHREDWPYKNYPKIFPYLNLRVLSKEILERDEFLERYPFEDKDVGANSVMLVMPTSKVLGVSMWGLSGDKEVTHLMFELNIDKLMIRAWHVIE